MSQSRLGRTSGSARHGTLRRTIIAMDAILATPLSQSYWPWAALLLLVGSSALASGLSGFFGAQALAMAILVHFASLVALARVAAGRALRTTDQEDEKTHERPIGWMAATFLLATYSLSVALVVARRLHDPNAATALFAHYTFLAAAGCAVHGILHLAIAMAVPTLNTRRSQRWRLKTETHPAGRVADGSA